MIVVDASVAVLGLLGDGQARRVLSSETLAAPHLVDAEVVHALRGQVRRRAISGEDGARALDRWSRLGLVRLPVVGLLGRTWALREALSAYDATYVALAEALDCPLVTADARLSRASGPRCPVTVIRS